MPTSVLALSFLLFHSIAFAVLEPADCPMGVKGDIEQLHSLLRAQDIRCDGGGNPVLVETCGFDAIRADVKSVAQCRNRITEIICKESMWKNLDLRQRFERIIALSGKFADQYKIDMRAIPCLAAKESAYLEPIIPSYSTCSREATDQGLGQIVYPTFKDLVENQKFQSKTPPFSKPPYTTNTRLLFSAMALNAELQIEIMSAVIKAKLDSSDGQYAKTFENYNGGTNKEAYGASIYSCFKCLRKALDKNGKPVRIPKKLSADPLDCLEKTDGIQANFEAHQKQCARLEARAEGRGAQ